MADFIDEFPLQEEVKAKLRSLGADSPAGLLASLDAAGGAAPKFLGKATLKRVRKILNSRMSTRERQALLTPAQRVYFGAQLQRPAPKIRPPNFNIAERDQLFDRLQSLRSRLRSGGTSPVVQTEVEELESRLNNMMER